MAISFRAVGLSAAACVAASIVLSSGPAPAQRQTVPHQEDCLKPGWGFLQKLQYKFGTVNICDLPVTIWFMLKGQRTIQRTLRPGTLFETEISDKSELSGGWIYAACPARHSPDVTVEEKNWDAILASKYACVPD